MSEMSGQNGPADSEHVAARDSAGGQPPGRPARPRRGLRIALVSLASLVVFLGAVAAGGYAYVNHLAGNIQRIPVDFAKLDGASQRPGSMTVLITSANEPGSSGLIMLLHINANNKSGGVVSIPPQTLVRVPGHGLIQINRALAYGGASLLVKTVEQVTYVPINHYARVKFAQVANLVNAVGGVNVTLPQKSVSNGYTFHAGVNHLNGITAVYYVHAPSLTAAGRGLRQQSLIRAILDKMANEHLLTNPLTAVHVIRALTGMLTVDSDFTNSGVESLATKLGHLSSRAGVFVTAPSYTASGQVYLSPLSRKLWTAMRTDSIAAFAAKYPATVTPPAPH